MPVISPELEPFVAPMYFNIIMRGAEGSGINYNLGLNMIGLSGLVSEAEPNSGTLAPDTIASLITCRGPAIDVSSAV